MFLWKLALGDAAVILMFSVAGIVSHHETGALVVELVRVASPFLAGYGLSAFLLGAWKGPFESKKAYSRRVIGSWGWGITIGILIRIIIEARVPIASFFCVAYGVTALLLAIWRALYWFLIASKSTASS